MVGFLISKIAKKKFWYRAGFLGSAVMCLAVSDAALADGCENYRKAYEVLKKESVFYFEDSPELRLQVWNSYLELLDIEKLYLRQQDFQELLLQFEDVSVLPGEATCRALLLLGSEVMERAENVHRDEYPRILKKLAGQNYKLAPEISHVVIPQSKSQRARSLGEFVWKWRKYLTYKYLEVGGDLKYSKFKEYMDGFFSFVRSTLDSPDDFSFLFASALYSVVDPHSNAFPYALSSSRRIATQKSKSVNAAIYEAVKLFSSLADLSSFFKQHTKIIYTRPRRVVSNFSSFYDIQAGDYIANLWSMEGREMDRVLALRRERGGLRWDHYNKIHRNKSLFYQQQIMHHFLSPSSRVIRLLDGRKYRKRRGSAALGHKVMGEKKSLVMYLSLRHFSSRSVEPDILVEKINKINKWFKSKYSKEYDYQSILIDLRNSSKYLDLKKYLTLMSVFLPRHPVAIYQNQSRAKVYSSGSGGRDGTEIYTYAGPLVVLVDQNTSGYGELMAATLQEYARAFIVGAGLGKRTSGRSYVLANAEHPLRRSSDQMMSYRVTRGFLWTAQHRSLYGTGMKPDLTLAHERDVFDETPLPQLPKVPMADVSRLSKMHKCYGGFSQEFIALLKDRSDKRVLQRTYPRQVLDQNMLSMEQHLSFEDAFQMSADDLRQQKPVASCEPWCSRLSLSRRDYLRDRRASEVRNVIYQKEPAIDYERQLEVAQDDAVLTEALSVADDYAYYFNKFQGAVRY